VVILSANFLEELVAELTVVLEDWLETILLGSMWDLR
jgi:hypothetical protein